MKRLALLAVVALAGPAPAQDRTPVRLIAEAEDFTPKSPGWKVVPYRENYFAGTFAVTFLSRMACLGAPEQLPAGTEAVAEQVVNVPYADSFELLARYEQPLDFSVEFAVEVEQAGKVVGRFPCGRLTDPRIWAFNDHKRVPFERYTWSGTDNIVWQHPGAVRLDAGPATLRLIASEQAENGKPRANAAKRHVDVLCLTNDRAGMEAQKKARYLEYDGWLVQDGDVFVRFTNPADAAAPVVPVVAPFDQGQHSPYYVHVRDWPTTHVLKSGRATTPAKYAIHGPRSEAVKAADLAPLLPPTAIIPDGEYLKPGERSGWVPLGPCLDALSDSQWFPQAKYLGKAPGEVYLRVEFAVPDKGTFKVVKDVTVKGKTANLSPACFDIPGVVNPNAELTHIRAERYWPAAIRTQKEVLDWLNAEVAKFPKRGSVPKRFLVYNLLGFSGALDAFPEAKHLATALGDNTAVNHGGQPRALVAHWTDPKVEALKKQEAARKGGLSDVKIVSYGDEIHLPPLPLTDAEFGQWLTARGVKYNGAVKFVPGEKVHPLYYYSQLAAREKGGAMYAAGTAYLKSKGVLTGANYSPHANFLVTEIDYVRTFKLKAMSMPWAEDYAWQIAEFSPQVVGYLTSALRCGAKYDDLPIHMYVMPHSPGQVPGEFRRSFYTAVGHGAKMVNYFCASPSAVGSTENYVDSYDLPMWKQIHACTHDAGTFEDYVMDGKVRPAKVGLLLSSVDDLITGVNNFSLALHNNERKAIYYALRHANIPVDFVTEDDIIEGRARNYQLIYVTQQYLHSRCIDALQKWCEAGGTVAALCGGGMKDEFQRENPAAARLYGATGAKIDADPQLVSRYLRKENTPFFAKHDLPRYEPFDAASWLKIKDVPVIAWKQPLTLLPGVPGGEALGTFRDGSPAVVGKAHGKGGAFLCGFLPGQAYLKSGLPLRPVDRGASADGFSHHLPTVMDAGLRDQLLLDGMRGEREVLRPVVVSAPLVETTVIDSPTKMAVTLVNWTPTPQKSVTVTIRDTPRPVAVRSVQRGELKFEMRNNDVVIALPLDAADMLLIDR
ncbi:type 1 glutamine amidotransferase family protein [Urbifossiella limnaea]|uniref:Beta-galactosidase trimerization domain protein n=1 Tax=Urbifossiella limnaea TaxID=2528023 RepID=A0A517Y0X4_9BACT|nr:hypothetical protein [Urbifossiella limnaea]QDU23358.1 Beta-galactosidase trimerization domain protein [Urbifossiella limnaea]